MSKAKRPGRPSNERLKKDGKQPIGLGQVCAALRWREGNPSQAEMGKMLDGTRGIDPRFARVFDKDDVAGVVGRCESDRQDISYARLHHYAKHADVSTACLYQVARFVSLLREAANCKDSEREAILAEGRERIAATHSLLNTMRVIIEDFEDAGFADGLKGPRLTKDDAGLEERRHAMSLLLIESYRGGDDDTALLDLFRQFKRKPSWQRNQ